MTAPALQWLRRDSTTKGPLVMGISGLKSRNGESGRSLLETAMVVMVAGVIAATSVVILINGKARYDLQRRAQSLTWQIERARSLAVKYNQTLTLGFTSQNSVLGLTCTSCTQAKTELADFRLPTGITLSAYPTLTIKGNGTISATYGTIVVSDAQGRQVPITISNSGRTSVGDLSDSHTTY
jgi:type II secretory pathway pseudopilin PulG